MQKTDRRYAYFHVRGSFDPGDLTRRLGVAPTKTARHGELIGDASKGVKRPCSRWELHSRLEQSAPFEQHVADVLEQLDVNRQGFAELSREFGGTMELVGYFRENEPGVALERGIIERMAQYGLTLDCDLYCRR